MLGYYVDTLLRKISPKYVETMFEHLTCMLLHFSDIITINSFRPPSRRVITSRHAESSSHCEMPTRQNAVSFMSGPERSRERERKREGKKCNKTANCALFIFQNVCK